MAAAPPAEAAPVAEAAPAVEAAPAAEAPAAKPDGAAEAPPPEVKPEVKKLTDEEFYGFFVDPKESFDLAREASKRIHDALGRLKKCKDQEKAGAGAGGEVLTQTMQEIQLQLLALRRAHRAMVKFTDLGRAVEATTRKLADAEHAHLETRRYESACCRAAERRCRTFPTPQLSRLKEVLGSSVEEAEQEADLQNEGETKSTGGRLAELLEAERLGRAHLAEELAVLEARKEAEREELRKSERAGSNLTSKLRVAELALEPVCDLLELQMGQEDEDSSQVEQLPTPLRLVFSKFRSLVSSGVKSVSIEGLLERAEDGEPPEKRAKTEATSSASVRVEIAGAEGAEAAILRFTSPTERLVSVAVEGSVGGGTDGLLSNLWPEDDGQHPDVTSLLPVDLQTSAEEAVQRPFGWAQVLAGLREVALASAPQLLTIASVKAADVVEKVRERLAKPPSSS